MDVADAEGVIARRGIRPWFSMLGMCASTNRLLHTGQSLGSGVAWLPADSWEGEVACYEGGINIRLSLNFAARLLPNLAVSCFAAHELGN